MSSLWGGRFDEAKGDLFKQFNDSFCFDRKLVFCDIAGSKAYAKALLAAGVLSSDENARISAALSDLESELKTNPSLMDNLDFTPEDVHEFIEHTLVQKIGDTAKKLHTGRSRNDQVATDLRLYLKESLITIDAATADLQKALATQAAEHTETLLPGFTHLQKAQVISWGHYLMSFVEMLSRDRRRLAFCKEQADVLPLGSGALAGNNYAIDRTLLAKELGFSEVSRNSLDATSDRDFVVEALGAFSLIMTHLSRLSEDLIIYCSSEYSYVTMGDAVATGSSLMPQKKNPDALELIRGKTGRVAGNLQGLLTTLKSLPSCYNKDMQEDKEGYFDSETTVLNSLKIMTKVITSLEINEETMLKACRSGYLCATDLADYLVAKGISFRDSHHIVGSIVQHAIRVDKPIEDLDLEVLQSFHNEIGQDVYPILEPRAMLEAKKTYGSTHPDQVKDQVKFHLGKLQ